MNSLASSASSRKADPYKNWPLKEKFLELNVLQNLKDAGSFYFKNEKEKLTELCSFLESLREKYVMAEIEFETTFEDYKEEVAKQEPAPLEASELFKCFDQNKSIFKVDEQFLTENFTC